jgi:hypothetical protein
MKNNKSIIDVVNDRMADPNYVPTGPTYAEIVAPPSLGELKRRIDAVNEARLGYWAEEETLP